MISLPDCSGFAPFRATSGVRQNAFGAMKSTQRRQPNSHQEASMPAKKAWKIAFCGILVALHGNRERQP